MKTEIQPQMISSASNLNISAKRRKILNQIGSILNSQSKTIKIDNRILPLFRRPLVIANREEFKNNDDKIKRISTLIIKENKLTSLSSQEKNKQISNLILGYFLDYLILKNLNLKKYLHQNNKLALIIKKKSDKLSNEI